MLSIARAAHFMCFVIFAYLFVNIVVLFMKKRSHFRQTRTQEIEISMTTRDLQKTLFDIREQHSIPRTRSPSKIEEQSYQPTYPKVKNKTWDECRQLVKQGQNKTKNLRRNDKELYTKYNLMNCSEVNQYFYRQKPSISEQNFPIAYAILVYKSAELVEKLLQAIYMPQNLYCVHIDATAEEEFRQSVQRLVSCLPNVFIAKKSVNVMYWHVSTVEAQISCMEDTLAHPTPWTYLINLCAQDYPLYTNRGLVQALQQLNGYNNIQSYQVESWNRYRTEYSHKFTYSSVLTGHNKVSMVKTNHKKSAPPHNITIFKGSSMIVGSRGFVEYVVNNQTSRDFVRWLNDTAAADETFYSSLQRHPGVPGGILGDQPEWLARRVDWEYDEPPPVCYGVWVRSVCQLGLRDLPRILRGDFSKFLFTQKIGFDFGEELLMCLEAAVHTYRNSYPCQDLCYPDSWSADAP